MGSFLSKRIKDVERQIRKIERGIKVAHKNKVLLKEPAKYNAIILRHGKERERLKGELEKLAGRREPESPEWPV